MKIDLNLLNKKNLQKISFLKSLFSPYTNRVYLVGGFVRDLLLGIENDDLDIEVHGISKKDFEKLMDKIGAIGVGKSFFVYKYENIDISLPRVESKVGIGHKGFEVKLAKNEYDATIRRDFTINSMLLNIFSGEIIDYFGGINDLKQKIIKVVNEEKFIEDSLRVLRGIRFASKFGFKIEKNSLKLMQTIKIDDLSSERIFEEFKKISNSFYLEYGFYYLIKTNIFYQLFSKKVDCITFIHIYRFIKMYKYTFCQNKKELFFLYILKNRLNININKLNLPKRFKKINIEPILQKYNDLELLIFAIDKPIKEYLFCFLNKKTALKYDIWDKKLSLPISAKEVIKDGFKGKDIKFELKKRQIEFIKKNLLKIN